MACRAVVLLMSFWLPSSHRYFNSTCCFLCPILLPCKARVFYQERMVCNFCLPYNSSVQSCNKPHFTRLSGANSAFLRTSCTPNICYLTWRYPRNNLHFVTKNKPREKGLFVGRWGKALKRDWENLHTALLISYDWPFFFFLICPLFGF